MTRRGVREEEPDGGIGGIADVEGKEWVGDEVDK